MMIEIEITSDEVSTREFTTKDGKSFSFREQAAWLHNGDMYPHAFVLSLGRRPAFAPGRYRLGVRSYRISRYGGLELSRELELENI